ncbi:hypothetical protein [Paenibacillus brevis]|uniref:Uncharacterized protein n=1 Tax=Paenibacillus brevis TaxID=2841508 RepID=A0ABS6FQ56_9BACL|nr:hypothetical protein [Paenibacillus brevis]MBU5672269.1 hypothetical protein [Paenibacillus brevis]
MASNEEKQLKIEVDISAIELAEEAMGRLDKLLEQTQRRAAALGRISVVPFILLERRATMALDRIERSLMRLNRTRVYPTVTLIDQVTAGVEQIRASMLSLTANPWRLSVEGVKWDEVVGDTFFRWIDGEGQQRLVQMSTKLGESLGNGIRESMMNSLGINGDPNQSILLPISPFESLLVPKNETVFEEAGRIAGEQFRNAFLQAVGEMLSIHLFDGRGIGSEPMRTFSGSGGSFKDYSGTAEWIRQFAVDNVLEGGEKISTDILDNKLAGYVSGLNIPPSAKKALGLLKTGFIIDLVTILAAEPGKPYYEAWGNVIGSNLLGALGTMIGGPLVGVPAAVLGGYGGEEIAGWFYDTSMMSDEERKKSKYAGERLGGWYPDYHAEEMLKEKPLGLYSTPKIDIKPDIGIPRPLDLVNPFDLEWWKPYYSSNQNEATKNGGFSFNNNAVPQKSETSVQVNLSPGTVNLTVQREEINYDLVANVSARMIANEVRLAMQNVQ